MPRDYSDIFIDNTGFIYETNLSGDPNRNKFRDNKRYVNLIVPTKEQAVALYDIGIKVKVTQPREDEEEGFVPTYWVKANINFNTVEGKTPPNIVLVSGKSARVLTEDELYEIDRVSDERRVRNVNAILSPYYKYDPENPSLWVQALYVEQEIHQDPYYDRYFGGQENEE